MFRMTMPVLGFCALLLPGATLAENPDSGSMPATQPQIDVLEEKPSSVTTRKPEARGMTTEHGMPVSPMQGRVSEELEARFGYYDIDRDGRISATEGKKDPELTSQWQQLDSNSDNQLDRAEFAGFEMKME